MPYIRVGVAAYDEIVGELGEDALPGGRPSGGFEYQSTAARFAPEELGLPARWVYDSVIAWGATKFRVRYDGGYDEGFAHPDALVLADGGERAAEQVADDLATLDGVAALRAVAAEAGS